MHIIHLMIVLSCLFSVSLPAQTREAGNSVETQDACDSDSDESCTTEGDEELQRGFDPCLINSALPACKPKEKSPDAGAGAESSSQAQESDNSG